MTFSRPMVRLHGIGGPCRGASVGSDSGASGQIPEHRVTISTHDSSAGETGTEASGKGEKKETPDSSDTEAGGFPTRLPPFFHDKEFPLTSPTGA